jgi:hypothetical protein
MTQTGALCRKVSPTPCTGNSGFDDKSTLVCWPYKPLSTNAAPGIRFAPRAPPAHEFAGKDQQTSGRF